MSKIFVNRVWVDGQILHAVSTTGEEASYNLQQFKGFRHASNDQIKDFQIIGNKSVYWPELDEDINLEGMFYDNHLCALSPSEDNVVYCGES